MTSSWCTWSTVNCALLWFGIGPFYWYPVWLVISLEQGWGLLTRFPPFRYFPNFSTSPKYMLAIEYHVHIWQVLPQLSCGDTCHIWMWFKECNRYFCEIDNFAYGEIDERSFSNPHPWRNRAVVPGPTDWQWMFITMNTCFSEWKPIKW